MAFPNVSIQKRQLRRQPCMHNVAEQVRDSSSLSAAAEGKISNNRNRHGVRGCKFKTLLATLRTILSCYIGVYVLGGLRSYTSPLFKLGGLLDF